MTFTTADLEKLLATVRELEPPWAKYRGKYELRTSEWLSTAMPILVVDARLDDLPTQPMVLVLARVLDVIRREMSTSPFGPPCDDEIAAFLAHIAFEQTTKRVKRDTGNIFGLDTNGS